jgi:hypothetical protein
MKQVITVGERARPNQSRKPDTNAVRAVAGPTQKVARRIGTREGQQDGLFINTVVDWLLYL